MSIPVSQRRKLRLRDIEELAQGHTASQWQRRDSHPGLCDAAARLIHDAWSEHGTVLFSGLRDGSFHSQPSLLSPPEEGSGRLGYSQRMFGLRCAHVSHSGNLPSCKRRTKSRRRGRPACPFPISQCLEVPLPFHHQSVPPWPEERQQKGTHMLDLRP